MNNEIPKQPNELLQELIEHLKILREDLTGLQEGKRYRIRTVLGQLRLLVCDRSKGHKGLLIELVKMLNYKGLIQTKTGESLTLEDFFNSIVFKMESGSEKHNETLADLIRKAAQEDGSSHAPMQRSRMNYFARAALEMGRTEKTDPYIGYFADVAYRILDYGDKFVFEILK